MVCNYQFHFNCIYFYELVNILCTHVFLNNSFILCIFIIDIDNSSLCVGLQTKGKFACLVCGPKTKSRRSKSLGNEVFDEYRHFLSKNHRYQTTEIHLFNKKKETALKPQIMTPHLWKFQYNRNRQGTYESSYIKCYEILFTVCCLL